MRLGDLLDELRTGILHDVSAQVAGASDYLWSDKRLVRYINQAQRRFARRTLCIRDKNTPQCCQIKTIAGQDEYPLDPSVIAVMSVRMAGDKADLARAGHSVFDTYHMPDARFFDPAQFSNLPPGKPLAYATDETLVENDNGSMGVVSLRLYPVIATPYDKIVGTMRVCRTPLVHLSLDDLDASPEIPEDYHMDMLDWSAHLALRTLDLDMASPERAAEFKASFEDHVNQAKKEMRRKLFAPAQWAFGRAGWTWESSNNG